MKVKINPLFKDVVLKINNIKELEKAKEIVTENGQEYLWLPKQHDLNKHDKYLFFNPITNRWLLSILDKNDKKVNFEEFKELFKKQQSPKYKV